MEKQKASAILSSIVFILLLLWVYTATSKLYNLEEFERQLTKQHFNHPTTLILMWSVPPLEILAAILLAWPSRRLVGLILSVALMAVFTAYIGLVLLGFYDKVPCSCGGVLKSMTWKVHFWFNLSLLILAAFGVWLQQKDYEHK